MDLIGPLPESNQYKYILTVQDYFTKWTEAYPLQDKTARGVAEALVNGWIQTFGSPRVFLSDNGKEFRGRVVTEVADMLGIERRYTPAYHAASNGLIERQNATLQTMLKNLVQETGREWSEVLGFATATYRSTIHESTRQTPNMMVLGREILLPIDWKYDQRSGKGQMETRCPTVYVQWLQDTLMKTRDLAK